MNRLKRLADFVRVNPDTLQWKILPILFNYAYERQFREARVLSQQYQQEQSLPTTPHLIMFDFTPYKYSKMNVIETSTLLEGLKNHPCRDPTPLRIRLHCNKKNKHTNINNNNNNNRKSRFKNNNINYNNKINKNSSNTNKNKSSKKDCPWHLSFIPQPPPLNYHKKKCNSKVCILCTLEYIFVYLAYV